MMYDIHRMGQRSAQGLNIGDPKTVKGNRLGSSEYQMRLIDGLDRLCHVRSAPEGIRSATFSAGYLSHA